VCGSSTCALREKPAPPGERRRRGPAGRISDYKLRLLEKQKLRFLYWMGERHFRGYVKKAARQLVAHGHITVNGGKVTMPSCRVRVGDTVAVRRTLQPVRQGLARASRAPHPPCLEVDEGRAAGTFRSTPFRQDIPVPVDETLVVEHCSRIM
jgi:small subunit ribosomal protein S4